MSPLRRLDSRDAGFAAALDALTAFEATQDARVDTIVGGIVDEVRRRGDAALVELTARLDRHAVASAAELVVPAAACLAAFEALPADARAALEAAAARVRAFHERQRADSWEFAEDDGTRLGQKVTPLDSVGIYVPGGKAAYPSSVLMNALPAKVAGVPRIVMTVPTPDGQRNDLLLAAAHVAGVDLVVTVGGAQAVAALAYGTATVPAVDKIVGPGNAYVAAAKRRVFGVVGIDSVAGPSEILVIADATANPDWVATDLFSQAEHDEAAQAILLSPDDALLEAVAASVERLLGEMPRQAVIAASLANRGALVRTADLDEACALANRIAPEHLELAVADPRALLPKIRHAGAVFLGHYSSEALGDYCAGPNHVLPTARSARFASPLGVYDFQKRTSVIEVTRAGARALGAVASTLARGEGLFAHARSAELRMEAGPGGATVRSTGASVPRPAAALAAAVVRPEIRALDAYHVASAEGMIKLDAMENPYRLPPAVRERLGRALAEVAVNRYPDAGARAVKALLRSTLGVPDGVGIALGNGSDELIQVIATALARPGATMLCPDPTFVMYRRNAVFAGMRYTGVPLREDFALDTDAFLAAVERERPALVFLAYPNNPTGNRFPRADVERVVRAAPGLVVVDEAYYAFAEDSFADRVAEFPNLLVLRTLSKIGLAGIRLGYALAAQPWIDELEKVRAPYNVGALAQAAALAILPEKELLAGQAAAIRAERERLASVLAGLPGCRIYPTETNFVLCRLRDATSVFEGLKRRAILVKNLHGTHPLLSRCLRITVGTPEENAQLVAAMEALCR
jgi:histidinol dehydrogenase